MERHRIWKWVGIIAITAIVALAVIGMTIVRQAAPILKTRITQTLSTRFNGRVELDELRVSIPRGLEVSGDGLRIYPPTGLVAAGATQPLIVLRHFDFHAGLLGLFVRPLHISAVRVNGMQINVPPRQLEPRAAQRASKHGGEVSVVVEEIHCEDSRLVIETANPGKDPKDFEIQQITLRDVGPHSPWQYDATLVNAIPRGNIHAQGSFGPWDNDSPGGSAINGNYTFDHADLGTIKGIRGVLSSTGNFEGQLNRIDVNGTTETPDFSLDTARHPTPLHTQFQAVVDGTTGDTYLKSVNARLRTSSFTTHGAVINVKGQGHIIDLDVDVPSAPVQDFLDLAVQTQPPVLRAVLSTKIKLHIGPGKESVTQKLSFRGSFILRSIQFTNRKIQDQVDMLSLRAQGHPGEAEPGAAIVASQMEGVFSMDAGLIHFSNLEYSLPGARVNLAGVYSLNGEQFDFRGIVLTDATLSQMVKSRLLSNVLKFVSPFFRKPYAGAEIPVRISGTKSAPHFGLDIFGK